MTEMEKDKLLDLMFAKNSNLSDQMAALLEELRLTRVQPENHYKDLKSDFDRMEERAIAAERRADAEAKRAAMETEAREKAEEQVADLIRLYRRLKDKESSFNDKNEKTQGWQTNIYH